MTLKHTIYEKVIVKKVHSQELLDSDSQNQASAPIQDQLEAQICSQIYRSRYDGVLYRKRTNVNEDFLQEAEDTGINFETILPRLRQHLTTINEEPVYHFH